MKWRFPRWTMSLLFAALALVPLHRTRAEDDPKSPASVDVPTKEENEEYYELLKIFVDTLDQIDRNYVKDISRRELMEAAIRGMVTRLDQYSNYIPPGELDYFKGSVESEFGGVGIQVEQRNGHLTIVSPVYGTPAYRAGLIAGDWITDIDGKTTKDLTLDEAIKRMKGAIGTKVKLTVVHPGDARVESVELTRELVRMATVLGDRRKDDDTWKYMFDDDKKIAYLRLTAFGRHTTDELKKALDELSSEKMRGLVLDLRFNPGGLLSSAIEVSDLFVSEGKIVSTAGRNVQERTVYAQKDGTYSGFPMVVLVNRFSASASEIVSACLQDHQRAVVVGERTWGKGSVQNIIELENGKSALKLTTAGYQRPNGKNIHRVEGASESDEWGVKPNDGYELKLSDPELRQLMEVRRQRDIIRKSSASADPFTDRQFQMAVEYLQKKIDEPMASADGDSANP